MKIYNEETFNMVMNGTTIYYTPAKYNGLLGLGEELVIHVLATLAGGTSPTLTVYVYASNDAQNWFLKNTLTAQALTANTLNSLMYYDNSSAGLYGGYGRLGFKLAAMDNTANVRAIVCGRGESVPKNT